MHDSTNSGRFYVDRTPRLVVGRNTAPGLNLAGVEPDSGTGATNYNFHVHYVDADSNLPVLHCVVVDSDTYDLVPSSHRYAVGVTFARQVSGFAPGRHEFKFVFSDGDGLVTTPPDTFVVTSDGVAEIPGGGVHAFGATPNPFSSRVRLQVPPGSRGLRVYDHCGTFVRSLSVSRSSVPGTLSWDGTDKSGWPLPAGVYFLSEGGGPLRRLLVKLNDR
jgi:hypothetical protein